MNEELRVKYKVATGTVSRWPEQPVLREHPVRPS
jgi:hypothetical protein